MPDASLPVQAAIFSALSAAVSPVKVYDAVPQNAAFPYLTIGDDTAADAGTKTNQGQEITLTIHAWSQYQGRKEVKELLGKVYDALHEKPLTVPGFSVSMVRFEYSDSFTDADGKTRHGVARYRVIITS